MDDYVSESDSDYTSYWRDWVSASSICPRALDFDRCPLSPHCDIRIACGIAGSLRVFFYFFLALGFSRANQASSFLVYLVQGQRVLLRNR